MEKVSLYIPCFNAEKTIKACLEAVFKQTYQLKEVLVVDDGSTDDTIKIASDYPVRIVRHGSNRGLAATRNTAIKNISTEFIASLDADCIPESDWLKHLAERLNSSKIAGVGGRMLETYSSTLFDFWRSVHMKQYWENNQSVPLFLFGSNGLYRKTTLEKIGLYDETYKNNYEDVDLSKRLKKAGYTLRYESKATVHHLKNDSLYSLLNSYWGWYSPYYKNKKYYASPQKFILKIKDNLGLANRYLEEDLGYGRFQLVYLDFLLGLHHSLRDFNYFISLNGETNQDITANHKLLSWLNLLDLTFFYHIKASKDTPTTLIPKINTFVRNFIALDLVLGRVIGEAFQNRYFQRILYKHLFISIYGSEDPYLLNALSNMTELHGDWTGFFKKRHPNLYGPFLKNLSYHLRKWLRIWTFRFPDITRIIEISAQKTNTLCSKKEDHSYESD